MHVDSRAYSIKITRSFLRLKRIVGVKLNVKIENAIYSSCRGLVILLEPTFSYIIYEIISH